MVTQLTDPEIVSHNQKATSSVDEAAKSANNEHHAAALPGGQVYAKSSKSGEQGKVQVDDPVTMSSVIPETSEKDAEPKTTDVITDAAAVDSTGSEPRESSQKSPEEGAPSSESQPRPEDVDMTKLFDRLFKETAHLSREELLARMPWMREY